MFLLQTWRVARELVSVAQDARAIYETVLVYCTHTPPREKEIELIEKFQQEPMQHDEPIFFFSECEYDVDNWHIIPQPFEQPATATPPKP